MVSGKARVAGVMGWPVSHSRSPRLHGFWLRHYGIDGAYVPLPVRPEDFTAAVRALPKLGFAGANITVPHKEAALAACDEATPLARRVGAVNTLVCRPDGSLFGDNTDGFGFLENLRAGCPGWRADAGPAVVLGAGGAARAIVAALLDAGCPQVRLTNRTRERAADLAADLGGAIEVVAWEERSAALAGAGLLVNTTTLGMTGAPPLDIALDPLPAAALVTDIVYAPLMTDLLLRAQARGHAVVDGLGMLLHQGRPGFEYWFGIRPEVTAELRAVVLGDAPA
ncbi:shikimate dehydrogenase [Caenispirillum bisanense]|uniref:shikimate dehydrogenase n=1 Tax=Caenispirillum bisanense TaxID=414052 RepID=UPI0031DA5C93